MGNKAKGKDIYICDIAYEVVEEDLIKLFSVCGSVRAVTMMTDPKSGQFRGSAFIRMGSEAEARDAINMLDGTRLINRCISVSAARQKEDAPPAAPPAPEKTRRRRTPKGRRKS